MSAEDDFDRENYFDTDDFGAEVVYLGKEIVGLYDEEAFLFDDGQQQFTTKQITVGVRTIDVPGVKIGSEICVDKTNYSVKDIQNDGTGMIELLLYIKDN